MFTINDLIKSGGIKSRDDVKYVGEIYCDDDLVREYNNRWGSISNTHMSILPDNDGYIITGSMIADRVKFMRFLTAMHWGGYTFRSVFYYDRECDFMRVLVELGLKGDFEVVNGETAFVIRVNKNTDDSEM